MTTRRRFLTLAGGTALGLVAAPRLLSLTATQARAQAIPGAPSFKGAAGVSIVGPVSLNAAVTVVRAQHNGNANFSVELFVPAPGETPQESATLADYSDAFLVFDLIGAVKPATALVTTVPGDHYLQVTASGAWQISVEQPLPAVLTPKLQTSFSGRGTDVSPYFILPPTISSISVSSPSTFLRAWLYHIDDLGGEAIQAGLDTYDARIFDFTDPANQTSYGVVLPVPPPPDDMTPPPPSGPYILAVNNVDNMEQWTIDFA
jgi:hypothetical protein